MLLVSQDAGHPPSQSNNRRKAILGQGGTIAADELRVTPACSVANKAWSPDGLIRHLLDFESIAIWSADLHSSHGLSLSTFLNQLYGSHIAHMGALYQSGGNACDTSVGRDSVTVLYAAM